MGDLRAIPGNQFEALRDDRKGQYSIRINDQWRICFTWNDDSPDHVEIVDYHWRRKLCLRTGSHQFTLEKY